MWNFSFIDQQKKKPFLQAHIWRYGFQSNELVGIVYDDVPEALERWHASGLKVLHDLLSVS